MGILDGVGLQFEETMSGSIGVGATVPEKEAGRASARRAPIRFDVQITIPDLNRFFKISDQEAVLSGTVTCERLGGTFPIRNGRFNLFTVNPADGTRQMGYAFRFTAGDGQVYFLNGRKDIRDDRGKFDLIADMTRLVTTVHCGENGRAPVYGAGELRFRLADAPALMASMRVIGAATVRQKVAAIGAFASFAYGVLRDEYLAHVRLFYDTRYENLVLSGALENGGRPRPFFFVSGVHDKGFPWGDGETFWDVLLAVEDDAGDYARYAITDRVLEGLRLDVEGGTYRYRGPIFAIDTGFKASFSDMRAGAGHLTPCSADIEIEFRADGWAPVAFPFGVSTKRIRRLAPSLSRTLRDVLPSEPPPGVWITPHAVHVRRGKITIHRPGAAADMRRIDPDRTFGEAERTTFRNVKEPTLLYGYICGIRPGARSARVQIHTDTLRDERQIWLKDRLDAAVGAVVARTASRELLMAGGELTTRPIGRQGEEAAAGRLFVRLGEPILEIDNDHFPTAVFQRGIIPVRDPSGETCLALEEDMEWMRLEAIQSDREVTVAAIRDPDNKFQALDRVLTETGFDALVEARRADTGKSPAAFSIVIKPNFMFAYNKRDRTTFTDPELVGHLVRRLRASGYERVAVAEAQSTYGEYFERRSVPEMARYLGYDGAAGYAVVDMTEDAVDRQYLGPHLGDHPVSAVWRDADFRVSFAKNKTHAYSFYTLTLKNIYGALPLANKFKAYHCDRDIYHTTIEYLAAFPVHYGLVDAVLSADGPFGIFADTRPNRTDTVIGGADLVAVDWVAASKMGIDPMISKHMRLAVAAFGKPAIHLIGDRRQYRPWLNVPAALSLFTHKGLDAEHHFGNLFYTATAQMDESHFRHKTAAWHVRMLRKLTLPLRRTFFVRTGEDPTLGNRMVSWVLYRLGY